MRYIIISDLHLGTGAYKESGEVNSLEDFHEDERFSQLLEFYSKDRKWGEEMTLILNGDIFNLIEYEDISEDFEITEYLTVERLRSIINGHPIFFEALTRFLKEKKHHCTFIIGNHDLPLVFPKAQELLKELVSPDLSIDYTFENEGVFVEHGQRFDPNNHIEIGQEIITNKDGESVIRLPWGSLFVMNLLPKLKLLRPYLDKIRPTSLYIRWCLFNDFSFFLHLLKTVVKYIVRTRSKNLLGINPNYKTTLNLLRKVSSFPGFISSAQGVFEELPHLKVVVLGHTHVAMWRKFPTKKLYFNCGTWNTVNAVDLGRHKNVNKLHFVEIKTNEKSSDIEFAMLKSWRGVWKPYQEEAGLGRS